MDLSTLNAAPPRSAAAELLPAAGSARYLWSISLVAAVGGFLFGYDLSLISGAVIFLKQEWSLTAVGVGAVMSSALLGCPVGPLAGISLADRIGRRNTLMASSALFVASTVGTALAADVWQFALWRFVGGAGVGLASTVSPMYIAEVAPARLRGRLVVVNQLAIVIGLSLSVYVTYVLSWGGHWRWMFATQGIPSLLFLAGLCLVPESPRWLASVGRREATLVVLSKINGAAQAQRELADICQELSAEPGGFGELLAPGIRRSVLIGIALMVFSQINGVNMILLYMPMLFMEAGLSDAPDAILNSVYVTSWITLCTIAAFWLTRQFGRRPILVVGTLAMACGHVLMFLNFAYHLPTGLTLAAMLVPTGAFTLSLAPLSWVVLSELYSNRTRGKAMSLAVGLMFLASFLTVTYFPQVLETFKSNFGHPGGTFLIFASICVACSVFVWLLLPETKDQTLEDIGRYWLAEGGQAPAPSKPATGLTTETSGPS